MAAAASNIKKELGDLYFLQLLYKELESNERLKGDIPTEIENIGKTLEKDNGKLNKLLDQENFLNTEIKNENLAIEEAEALITKYEKQQKNIRNNKEFESFEREIEYQKLEIELSNKNLGNHNKSLEEIEEKKAVLQEQIKNQESFLTEKKAALNKISEKTDKKSNALRDLLKANESKIKNPKLINIYNKRKEKGLNVVATVERQASTVSNIVVPTAARSNLMLSENDIIIDEYSGCFLIDEVFAQDIEKKAEKEFKKLVQ